MATTPPIAATLDANGVAAPLIRAVRDSIETIAVALTALETADLSAAPKMPGVFFGHTYRMDPRDPAERKAAYISWLLSKGYQDVARGTREMLEEAFLYLGAYKTLGAVITWGDVLEMRRVARAYSFPDLLRKVDEGLPSPLIFTAEMLSLQKVRNCLEHRGGTVGDEDLDASGKLKLVLPRWAFFAKEDSGEVEIYPDYRVKKDTALVMKRLSREREYALGDRIAFTPQEFTEIAHSCWLLSQDLGQKLPHPSKNP